MKKRLLPFAGLLLIGLPTIFYSPERNIVIDREKQEESVEMSVKEQLGQMLIVGFEGTEMTPQLSFWINEIQPGGILLLSRNIKSERQTRNLVSDIQEISETPLFVAVDQEGGSDSRIWFLKEQTAQSELKDFDHAVLVGKERALELAEFGVNMNLAPVLDSQNRGDYIFLRSFQGKEHSLTLALGLLEGYKEGGIIPVPKHFPGYDGVSFNPEEGTIPRVLAFPNISLFKEVFKRATIPFVMISHVVYEELDEKNPLPFSQNGISLLRKSLGEDVLVMSDDLLSRSFTDNYKASEIGAKALEARIDVLLVGGYPRFEDVQVFYEGLLDAVLGSKKLQAYVKNSAERILELKERVGL